jgi:hypothetical protein
MASRIASSGTVKTSVAQRRISSKFKTPGFGAVRPSAMVCTRSGAVGLPAASDRTMPSAPAGWTP